MKAIPQKHPTRRELAAIYRIDHSTSARILGGSIWL